MATIECTRCGTEFDTEREEKIPYQNTRRCSSCGKEPEVLETEVVNEPSEPSAPVSTGERVQDALAEAAKASNGDVHIHFHDH